MRIVTHKAKNIWLNFNLIFANNVKIVRDVKRYYFIETDEFIAADNAFHKYKAMKLYGFGEGIIADKIMTAGFEPVEIVTNRLGKKWYWFDRTNNLHQTVNKIMEEI
ncbi:MAG: hypothetical protein PHE63_00335 [Eubacteriales bacterium]|nr:hypothetical protein [Eubacteriales bacterium]